MKFFLALISLLLFSWQSPAWAESLTANIVMIDTQMNSLLLSDGHSYELPEEFDFTTIHKGMKVTICYDIQDSNRYITDLSFDKAKEQTKKTPVENSKKPLLKTEPQKTTSPAVITPKPPAAKEPAKP